MCHCQEVSHWQVGKEGTQTRPVHKTQLEASWQAFHCVELSWIPHLALKVVLELVVVLVKVVGLVVGLVVVHGEVVVMMMMTMVVVLLLVL